MKFHLKYQIDFGALIIFSLNRNQKTGKSYAWVELSWSNQTEELIDLHSVKFD